MNADFVKDKHTAGLGWDDYLATGTPDQQKAWQEIYDKIELSDDQKKLLGDFVREINAIVVTGIWCGDCVRQGPMFQRIAEASNGKIKLAWCDRDEHMDLQKQVTVNAGQRVPVVVFASEDYETVGWYGDKPLARYRIVAKQALGASCPMPGAPVPQDELDAELADWVDQFERVHLLLRLSGRLRQKHGD